MIGLPILAAVGIKAKRKDKKLRNELKPVAKAMLSGGMAFRMKSDPLKISNGSDKKEVGAFRTRILAQQERKKQSKPLSRVKSDLPDNSPNALEIGLKKAKEKAEESAMERKKNKGVEFTTKDGTTVAFRMRGMPPILREPTEKQKANLPPNLVKAIEDAPPMSRYNSETMEMENLKPLNRAALGMTGREGDNIPMMRSYGTPYKKHSAAGKAKLMKTKYGQSSKAIPNKQLIQPIFKKAKKRQLMPYKSNAQRKAVWASRNEQAEKKKRKRKRKKKK